MLYKVFIAVVWLMLPLSVLLMLQRDQQRWHDEGQLQRQLTEDWESHFGDYIRMADIQGRLVADFDDPYDRVRWEQDWRSIENLRSNEEQQLGPISFSHYPRTQDALEKVSGLAREQRRAIDEAARLKDSYLGAAEALFRLQQEMDQLEDAVRWWRFQQQIGIYLNLQDHLAKLESAYRQRRSARNELNRSIGRALREADDSQRQALGELSRLAAARDEDESMTYRQHLRLRFEDFDFKAEWAALITPPRQAGARQ